MLTINLVFILRKSVNYSVNLFSNRNMNSAIIDFALSILNPHFNCISTAKMAKFSRATEAHRVVMISVSSTLS